MLLNLDDSLIDYMNSKYLTDEEIDAFERIFQSHKNKYHFVFGSRYVLQAIARNTSLPSFVREQSMKWFKEFPLIEPNTRNKKSVINVIPSNMSFDRVDYEGNNSSFSYAINHTQFFIPLDWFTNPALLERTCLISENSSDVKFYLQLSKGISKMHHPNSDVIFSKNSGGGGTTFKVIEDKIDDQNIVLVVVDSDKIHPKSNYGDTYTNAYKAFSRLKHNSVLGFKVLSVHEKENLIPPLVYSRFTKDDEVINNSRPWQRVYNNELIYDIYNYADLKKGISAENYCAFYESLFDGSHKIVASGLHEKWDFEKEFVGTKSEFEKLVEEYRAGNCENQYLLPPLASNILDDFTLKDIHQNSVRTLEEMSKSKTVNPKKESHRKYLEEKVRLIEAFDTSLNEFHKHYLSELSERIKDWGFCNTKAI